MPWLRHLAVLFAFLAAFVRPAPAPASAFTPASPETRVGGFEVAAQLLVGDLGAASREQHQGIGAAYDEEASGYRFAAGGAGEATTALVKAGPQYGKHVLERMTERGITPKMVEKALEKGTPYWDPKNQVINRVLEGGFGSGKDLLVGQNPVTGKITTVIRGSDLVSPRFVPLE